MLPAAIARMARISSSPEARLSVLPQRARFQHFAEIAPILVHREHQHLARGLGGLEPADRFQPAHCRHRKIDDKDIGAALFDQILHLTAVISFANHLHIGLRVDQVPHALSQDSVIIDEHDADFSVLRWSRHRSRGARGQ